MTELNAVEAKRLDSLARNRASAELKRRHEDEWKSIFDVIHNNLKAELALTGSVDRERAPITHVAGEDGKCAGCGKPSPCQWEKKRVRERAYRTAHPVVAP